VLVQSIRDLRQPRPVLDLLQQFRRGKELDAVRWRIAQRFEQASRNKNWHIMRLAIQHPGMPALPSDVLATGSVTAKIDVVPLSFIDRSEA
jgi:hypothetical protein